MADETDGVLRSLSAPVLGRPRTVSGRVKWFNAKRGFGYIVHENSGQEVFVRRNAISKRNPLKRYPSLGDGEEVDFVLRRGEKGWEAGKVTGPAGACVKGSEHTPKRESRKRRGKRRKRKQLSTTAEDRFVASSQPVTSLPGGQPRGITAHTPPHAGLDSEMRHGEREAETPTKQVVQAGSASLLGPQQPGSQPRCITARMSLHAAVDPEYRIHHGEREAETPTKQVEADSTSLVGSQQKYRSTRELSHSEVASLLYVNKFTQRLLFTPNVVSVCYTDEKKKGEKTGKKVLQVGVITKMRRQEVKRPNIHLPKEVLHGKELVVPVQVVERGKFRIHVGYSGGAHLRVHHGRWVYGTLGARELEPREKGHRILSCAHVLTEFRDSNIGKIVEVAHPMQGVHPMDAQYRNRGWQVAGHARVKQRHGWLIVKQDLAWAYVGPQEVSCDISNKRQPEKGMQVQIYGGYSKTLVTGNIMEVNVEIKDDHAKTLYRKMCLIGEMNRNLNEGDSGSAVIDENNRLVGIYVGACDDCMIFSPLLRPLYS